MVRITFRAAIPNSLVSLVQKDVAQYMTLQMYIFHFRIMNIHFLDVTNYIDGVSRYNDEIRTENLFIKCYFHQLKLKLDIGPIEPIMGCHSIR